MARNVARGSLLGLVGQFWHLVTAFLLYAFLARRLGPALFGEWRVALSVLAWFEIVVTSSVSKVITREIGRSPEAAARFGRAGYIGQTLAAIGVFAVAQAAAGPVAAALADPALEWLIRIAAFDIPLYALMMAASAVVLGRERYERQGIAWIVYATAKAALIAGAVAAGYSVPGALAANALSSLVGFGALFVRVGADTSGRGELWRTVRWALVASVPFLVLGLVQGVGAGADLWLVSARVRDEVAIGLYASATVLAEVPVFLFIGLNRVIFPSVAAARAAGEGIRADAYASQAVRAGLIVTVFGVAFVAALGRPVLELVYSAAYVPAFLPLVLLMVAGAGRTIQATCIELLMADGRRTRALVVLGGTVVAEVAAVIVLADRFGIVGAAAGTALASSVAAVVTAALLRSAVGIRPIGTLARSLAAGAAVSAALWWCASAIAPVLLPVLAVVGGLAYAGLLAALREFEGEDVATLRAAVGR